MILILLGDNEAGEVHVEVGARGDILNRESDSLAIRKWQIMEAQGSGGPAVERPVTGNLSCGSERQLVADRRQSDSGPRNDDFDACCLWRASAI